MFSRIINQNNDPASPGSALCFPGLAPCSIIDKPLDNMDSLGLANYLAKGFCFASNWGTKWEQQRTRGDCGLIVLMD